MPYQFRLDKKRLSTFLGLQFGQLGLLFIGWYLLFPDSLQAQLDMGIWACIIAFLLMHLFWCFFEFFLHRYVLHMDALPFLGIFAQKHNAHHALTYVRKNEAGGVPHVESTFPILVDAQRKHSVFPDWALIGFLSLVTPFAFLMQWLIPALPIFIGAYIAGFVTYVGYEVIHAYEHRSYALWWKPRIDHPTYGKYWERFYAFHLTHHAQPRSNESISGFLGFPLADILLGTYKRTTHVLVDGQVAEPSDFEVPQGGFLIRFLDRHVRKLAARRAAHQLEK